MRIFISTSGTPDDAQPFVALGKALQSRGHVVAVCAPSRFRPLIEVHGLAFAHMDDAALGVIQTVRAATTRAEQRRLLRGFHALIRRTMDDEWRAAYAFRPDALVYHAKSLASHHIAEKLGVPEFLAMKLPFTPTRAFPMPLLPDLRMGGCLNMFSHRLAAITNAFWSGVTNDFRLETLGLRALPRFADSTRSRVDGRVIPRLHAITESVFPRPSDWPDHAHITGCWLLDDDERWRPPAALRRFLENGPAPMFVGLGNVAGADAQVLKNTVLEALSISNHRAVVAPGWLGSGARIRSSSIFELEAVAPHRWLFSRMTAIAHHGQTSCTTASLQAGKPTVICRFVRDQPFWGTTVFRAGVGPSPIPPLVLTAERLAAAIHQAHEPDMVARAAAVGRRIRSEDGAGRAARIIEKALMTPPASAWAS